LTHKINGTKYKFLMTNSSFTIKKFSNQEKLFEKLKNYPFILKLVRALVDVWPAHFNSLEKSILSHDEKDYSLLDYLSQDILKIINGEVSHYLESYRWLCDTFNEEQLFFYRHKRYRLSSFEEARVAVYSNPEYMKKYMEGLLISQLFWYNHAKSYIFHNCFINRLSPGFSYLEIGPGHGLYLSTVANQDKCALAEAWDFSAESLRQTSDSISKIGINKSVRLLQHDVQGVLTSSSNTLFDAIVISEVLEHLEQPKKALEILRAHLAPKGNMLINFPINSPAPDHIFFLDSLESVVRLVESAGLKVKLMEGHSSSGYTLGRAMEIKAAVSVLVIACA
jgi:2-polyprenyl-3-methyl-5-hydroxy-6-metoxy-1,4-benzoquinol methylase